MEYSVHSMTKITWEEVTNILVASCGVDRRPLALWMGGAMGLHRGTWQCQGLPCCWWCWILQFLRIV